MKYLALVCLLFAGPATADIYKCVKNGQVAYQEAPCQGSSQQTHMITSTANEFVGCFALDTGSPWTNTEQHDLVEIRSVNGGYALIDPSQQSSRTPTIMLKRAAPDALDAVSRAFNMQANDGLTVAWSSGDRDTKPIGIYKVKDRRGEDGYLVYLHIANGVAHKVACPATHAS